MRSTIVKYILALLLAQTLFAQTAPGCLNHNGEVVDWFLIYYTPGTVHKRTPLYGYMYHDSNSKSKTFNIYQGWGDQANGPLGKTIAQAKTQSLQSIAWNDQLQADQGVGNSQRAHSKFFMSLKAKSNGFAVVHSSPKFPTFSSDGQYTQPQIDDSQKVKAQHIFCFTVRGRQVADKILQNSCFIKPNIYHNSLEYNCKPSKTLGKLVNDLDKFIYENYQIGKTLLRAVYKNGDETADIFTEGITNLVQSSIVIETFGSPKPYPPYCADHYTVGNTQQIVIADGIRWTQGSDHAKWVYALDKDYVCFGDLNRNTKKQEERGGSFYCFESPYLNGALKGINPEHSGC